ncbi:MULTISPECIES: hypothetical protein [unclassified Arthrobacter]|uniref:hypothetical protein n=1 Tax=unclassified Arthrobacter TaxID=235627 RepID=UPI00159E28DC|nr:MULTISPECIES: hypothetical protein [unclassified Arthrobacter]MCQ9163075.1 hypothetical protein [Arthrobacter sp. STN4]NVM97530.1 hypothetical protein [Arthrobacter sp. SDTb3-6]
MKIVGVAAPARVRFLAAVASAAGALALGGCTIAVPVPGPTATVAPPSTFAAPTIQAGHDAAAVAAKNMTFPAGTTLSRNVPVGYNDILGQGGYSGSGAPAPPEWKLLKNNVAGQTLYSNTAGCQLAYWATSNQGPLITPGDDLASTRKLMAYLIPSVVPESLKPAELPWSAEAGKGNRTISFLSYGTKASKGVPASTVWGRLLGTAGTGLVVSLACPTDALLASTTPRVMDKLSVAPPAN